jgi:hypothetical protein
MINDDLNRINPNRDAIGRNDFNQDSLGRADTRTGFGGGMIAIIVAVAAFAILFMWAPWNHNRTADNTGPGTTVGSATRPATPAAPVVPTTPSPAAPAPSTTK